MRFDVGTVTWTLAIAIFVWLISMVAFESEYVYTLIFSILAFLNGILFGLVLIRN